MNWPSTWEWSLFLFYLQHGAEQELMAQNMACHKLLLVKTLPCLHLSLLVFFWEQSINIKFYTERKLCKIEIKWKERLPKLVLCSWSEVFNNKLFIRATEKKNTSQELSHHKEVFSLPSFDNTVSFTSDTPEMFWTNTVPPPSP